MSAAFGPAVLTIACFQLGVVASCTPRVRELVPRVLALTGAADQPARWRRVTVLTTFAAGVAAFLALALGMSAPIAIGGALRVRGPASRGWGAAATWTVGVALAYVAFTHVRDRSYALEDFVKSPYYDFGIVTGALFALGAGLAALHVVFDARAPKGSRLARASTALRIASIVAAVVGGSLFASWAPHPHGNAPPVAWHGDETSARSLAAEQGRPVIVKFNAEWCCKEIERETFPDPRVREEATRFVSIAVDATDEDAEDLRRLQDKYKVAGLPTIVVVDSAGREAGRFNSYVKPEVVAAMLHDVH